MAQETVTPFARPLYIMTKPAGALCNLACDYCYYLEKKKLYPNNPRHVMSDELLERFTRDYIAMQTTPEVLFTWHGGETLMRPVAFYKKAIELQKKYAGGRRISNAIQTNGTLITREWAEFFKKNNFLVGLSLDGPEELHDEYRRARNGKPTFQQVMKGVQWLNHYGVEWNAMAAINDFNGAHPLEFYHFFKSIGCQYIQFTPVVERFYRHTDGRLLASPIDGAVAELAPFSVKPDVWGDFLCTIFDEWVKNDVAVFYVQIFDATLANWMNLPPSVCSMAETCGHAAVMEFNGDVYACDHYVFPEFKLGNIHERTLLDMMNSPAQLRFGENKRDLLTAQCRDCEYLFACHGECPRNRFAQSADGEEGHNFLCEGYNRFFRHVAPYMDFMKYQLMHNQAPAKVMEWIAQGMPDYRKEK